MTPPQDPINPSGDPPLSPKEFGIPREDEADATARAASSARISATGNRRRSEKECLDACFGNVVAKNPCASVAVAFAVGLLAGTILASDYLHGD